MSKYTFFMGLLMNLVFIYSLNAQQDEELRYTKAFLESYWSVTNQLEEQLSDASIFIEDSNSDILGYKMFREISDNNSFIQNNYYQAITRGRLLLKGVESNFIMLLGGSLDDVLLVSFLDEIPNSQRLYLVNITKGTTSDEDVVVLSEHQGKEVYTLERLSNYKPNIRYILDHLEGNNRRFASQKATESLMAPNWVIHFSEADQVQKNKKQFKKKYPSLTDQTILKVGQIKAKDQLHSFAIIEENSHPHLIIDHQGSSTPQIFELRRNFGAYPYLDQIQLIEKDGKTAFYLDQNPFSYDYDPLHLMSEKLDGSWLIDVDLTTNLGTETSTTEEDEKAKGIKFEVDATALDFIPKHAYSILYDRKIYLAGFMTFTGDKETPKSAFIVTEFNGNPTIVYVDERNNQLYLESMEAVLVCGRKKEQDLLFIGNGIKNAQGPSMPPIALRRSL